MTPLLSPRSLVKRFYNRHLDRTTALSTADLGQSAIVFAPHPDDETLGCGGTILRKTAIGARVEVVFMTDGAASHPHLMPPETLKGIRVEEAIAAGRVLGLAEANLRFLEFPDGQLSQHFAAAVEAVAAHLMRAQPEAVFIPYDREPGFIADHGATHDIVLAALEKTGLAVTVYEYPIWFWYHWPWAAHHWFHLLVPTPKSLPARLKTWLKNGIFSTQFGLSFVKDFQYSTRIEDLLGLKWAAIQQHRSQISRLLPDPDWQTLTDVADGDFLACFFQKYEVFRRYSLAGNPQRVALNSKSFAVEHRFTPGA